MDFRNLEKSVFGLFGAGMVAVVVIEVVRNAGPVGRAIRDSVGAVGGLYRDVKS